MATNPSPYLLGDVIAALQFLGRYDEYKLSTSEWAGLMKTPPQSSSEWTEVFRNPPEFFRESKGHDTPTNPEKLVSLTLRRVTKKTGAGRQKLDDATIASLIDSAVKLHADARDDAHRIKDHARADRHRNEDRQVIDRRLNRQLWVSIAGVVFAFTATLLAAWIKISGG
ncbi:hypothetical protein NZK35_23145 [Stieleria sp. ICT_E10.1]|uniref:hypothetical protein n=1 Tax=Stieleria sedimenti TaxID=2976331 RepID=UPI00217FEB9E|nr:hypothetical protein [Stieleria sedimenti]MCS7469559.1 hypothetical protein [Stieleria sedimenti]